ncbi:hypothetical protein B0H66DRAFT_632948 [Apodospora peruviana]|uniref:Rhodopsin domain-containing protein n=1 Tax=Apodospora peruviana TaxID=516989 RepID=A0AAE0LYE8_9PEZI|nr:hypothetical protein B0H66DRAFT_632948 [Apodospora peruviana]
MDTNVANGTHGLSQADFADENRGDWLGLPVGIFSSIIMVLIILRFWARKDRNHNRDGLGADDWFCLAATLFGWITNMLYFTMTHLGFGQHIVFVETETLSQGLLVFWFLQYTFVITQQTSKISLLLLYIRLFGEVTPWLRRTCFNLVALLVAHAVVLCVVNALQCQPIDAVWNGAAFADANGQSVSDDNYNSTRPNEHRNEPRSGSAGGSGAKCINLLSFFIFNGIFYVITDLIIWALPLQPIWHLNMPWQKKLMIAPAFGLGILVVASAAVRLWSVFLLPVTPDLTYDISSLVYALCEYNIGIICASLPILPAISRTLWFVASKKYRRKTRHRRAGSGHLSPLDGHDEGGAARGGLLTTDRQHASAPLATTGATGLPDRCLHSSGGEERPVSQDGIELADRSQDQRPKLTLLEVLKG